MAKLSTIEIAKKQRHLFLLQKVKENKTLSKAELDELKRYERQAAGKIISKIQPEKKKWKVAAMTKRVKKKARLPVDEAEIRRLGLECENLTEADAAIRTRKSLKEILKTYPQLRQAWDRGRFLRKLRALAGTVISVSDAAKKLGLANGQVLRSMIDEDEEVGDLWNLTRFEIDAKIRLIILDKAEEGDPAAIRAVERFLLDEKERPEFDPYHITIFQLTEFTGTARQRIHEWYTKFGLQRNADNKTFDLGILWAWRDEFLLKKASVGKESATMLDPLKTMKAEKLKLELAKHRNELLERSKVIISLVAWAQNIVSKCEHGIPEFSRLCSNQPREKIAEIARAFFRDLHSEAAKVPKELRLPAAKERELIEFLQGLKPHDDR